MPESEATDDQSLLESDLYGLTKDYAQYLRVDSSKERQAFYNSIEEMLTKLDEFGGLVDTIRSDTSLCIDKNIQEIQTKCEDMKHTFRRIDQLEAFVQIVKENVFKMEEQVNKAENEMGSFSSFRKIFSSLVGSKKPTQVKEEKTFTPPDIFVTEEYLKPVSRVEQTVQAESANEKADTSQDVPNVKVADT